MDLLEDRTLLSTIFVDASSDALTKDGTSWESAFVDLQDALSVAIEGDEIRVAGGTYKPTNTGDRKVTFQMKDRVSVLGAFAGKKAANPNTRNFAAYPTILSGDIGQVGIKDDNSTSIVSLQDIGSTTILDGFTIDRSQDGSGLQIIRGSPRISNCIFSRNLGWGSGGGIYSYQATPTITNCSFLGNRAESGGGIFCSSSGAILTNCVFSGNTGARGAGIHNSKSSPILNNCTFTRNMSANFETIANTPLVVPASAAFSGVISIGNDLGGGGGMYNESSSPKLANCVFNGNSSAKGAAIYNSDSKVQLTNCTLVGNKGRGSIYNVYRTSLSLAGCTLTANYSADRVITDSYDSSNIHPTSTLVNCIVWGNISAIPVEPLSSRPTVTYSNLPGGSGTNIDADPAFARNPFSGADGEWGTADDDYGDLRLRAYSSAVDVGSNSAVSGIDLDLAGGKRIQDVPTARGVGSIVDMGAYEAVPALEASPGAPYAILEGDRLNLTGRGASNVAGNLQFAWEWTGDGRFNDSSGLNPVFDTRGFATGSVISVSLRVTDVSLRTTISTTTLRILPKIVHVDSRATGNANGTNWNHAFTSLAEAVNLALPGVTIKVAVGTYKPAETINRSATFSLRSDVALMGGYAGLQEGINPDTRDFDLYRTVLSGDLGLPGNIADNSYHVVSANGANGTLILDGFVITGGNANGGIEWNRDDGGGLYCVGGGAIVSNCTFSANTAKRNGAAVYGVQRDLNAALILADCVFSDGSAENGGGVYAVWSQSKAPPQVIRCTFTGNVARSRGGAMNVRTSAGLSPSSPRPLFSSCLFTGNSANGAGGIELGNEGATIEYCDFRDNTAVMGGALTGGESLAVFNCTFTDNSATRTGGAYEGHGGQWSNCSFSNNTAGHEGGAMLFVSASFELSNCVFTGNSAAKGGAIYEYSLSSTPVTQDFSGCTFSRNAADYGGAIYNGPDIASLFNDCVFTENSANYSGGAIYNRETALLAMNNCLLTRNSALSGGGGAIYNRSAGHNAPDYAFLLENCTFNGNRSWESGGAIGNSDASLLAVNCAFAGNSTRTSGGAASIGSDLADFVNCTFAMNAAETSGGAIIDGSDTTIFTNCIFWGNNAANDPHISKELTRSGHVLVVRFSDVESGWVGQGNINVDPLFVRNPDPGADGVWRSADDDYGDLSLQSGSPCIDAADDSAIARWKTVDLLANPRFIDVRGVNDPKPIADIGALEFQGGSIVLKLAVPPSVNATDGEFHDKVIITWDDISGEAGYEILRGLSDDPSSATKIAATPTDITSFEDLSVVPLVRYRYWVRAVAPVDRDAFASDIGPGDVGVTGIQVSAAPRFARLDAGKLIIDGTSGKDTISLSRAGGAILVTRNNDEPSSFSRGDIRGIQVFLGSGDDEITIGPGIIGAFVDGGDGYDTIIGGDGNDTLLGGNRRDSIDGGLGHDRVDGGKHDDRIYGSEGDDFLYGGQGKDLINGDLGRDRICGGTEDDTIFGGNQNDTIYGDAGNDSIDGQNHNDRVYGGTGIDRLFGGKGKDIFVCNDGLADIINGGTDQDTATGDGVDVLSLVESLV